MATCCDTSYSKRINLVPPLSILITTEKQLIIGQSDLRIYGIHVTYLIPRDVVSDVSKIYHEISLMIVTLESLLIQHPGGSDIADCRLLLHETSSHILLLTAWNMYYWKYFFSLKSRRCDG